MSVHATPPRQPGGDAQRRELVQHDRTGYLVPPRDDRALAGAIEHLIGHPDTREAFGRAGLEFAHRMFDAGANTRAVIELYEKLLVSTL